MKGMLRYVVEAKMSAVDEEDAIQSLARLLYKQIMEREPTQETIKRVVHVLDKLGNFTFIEEPTR